MASGRVAGLLRIANGACKTSFRFSSSRSPFESSKIVTHTGQVFDENDYRNVRFMEREREVNPNWGIKLIAEAPPASTKARIVACDGGDGPLGHPKVYINLDKPGNHTCGYCGLRFYKDDHH